MSWKSVSVLIESNHFQYLSNRIILSQNRTPIRVTDYRFIEFIVLYTILVAFNFSNKTFTSNEKLVTDFKKERHFWRNFLWKLYCIQIRRYQ